MTRFQTLRRLIAVAVLGASSIALSATSASAGDYRPASVYRSRSYHFETVVTYETRLETVTRYVTRYDHCGRPYQVAVTDTRVVKVPVKRLVKVWD